MSVTLHTNLGELKIEVFCESVPKTAEVSRTVFTFVSLHPTSSHVTPNQNFLALCASHYYDSSPFHRVISGFMAQTGGPAKPNPPENPKGGRNIWNTSGFEDEIRPGLKHASRGVVSMANKGPGTNGSQFFITFAAAPHLDGLNTVFGRLIDGEDTLKKIESSEVDKKNRPRDEVKIERVTIHANPLAG